MDGWWDGWMEGGRMEGGKMEGWMEGGMEGGMDGGMDGGRDGWKWRKGEIERGRGVEEDEWMDERSGREEGVRREGGEGGR